RRGEVYVAEAWVRAVASTPATQPVAIRIGQWNVADTTAGDSSDGNAVMLSDSWAVTRVKHVVTRDVPALDVSVRGGDGCFLVDDIVLHKLPQSAPPCPCYEGEPGTYCGAGARAYAAAHGCWLTGVSDYEHNILGCQGGAWSVSEV